MSCEMSDKAVFNGESAQFFFSLLLLSDVFRHNNLQTSWNCDISVVLICSLQSRVSKYSTLNVALTFFFFFLCPNPRLSKTFLV